MVRVMIPQINKMKIVLPVFKKQSNPYIYTSIWSDSGLVFETAIIRWTIFEKLYFS